MRDFIRNILPFIIFGILLAIFGALAVFLSYLLLWGIAIGIAFYLIVLIKDKFFPKEEKTKKTRQGRIIEHNEDKD